MPTDPILIVGTGALACLFAARLVRSGARVAMLGSWPEGLKALRTHGVRFEVEPGEVVHYPVRVIDGSQNCSPYGSAIVLVKSWQTRQAAKLLPACLASNGTALTLQNGLGNREALENTLGETRVALGTTTTGATLLGPGHVRPGGEGEIHLQARRSLQPLADWLALAGFSVHQAPDVESLVWGKLVINAAINPLTALLEVPNGALLKNEAARELMKATARETAAVAAARGIALPFDDPAAAAEEVARRTAPNYSSMLQDIRRGAPTEIDAICGAIASTAQEAGAAAPINRTLWRLVKAKVEEEAIIAAV
ncbi:MAG: 2-dehydropantoate 2-reductase [Anaerolineales bacterium]|nr:2-dehydropantoate 2-reductase [Anaerolineales bacterium]